MIVVSKRREEKFDLVIRMKTLLRFLGYIYSLLPLFFSLLNKREKEENELEDEK